MYCLTPWVRISLCYCNFIVELESSRLACCSFQHVGLQVSNSQYTLHFISDLIKGQKIMKNGHHKFPRAKGDKMLYLSNQRSKNEGKRVATLHILEAGVNFCHFSFITVKLSLYSLHSIQYICIRVWS